LPRQSNKNATCVILNKKNINIIKIKNFKFYYYFKKNEKKKKRIWGVACAEVAPTTLEVSRATLGL